MIIFLITKIKSKYQFLKNKILNYNIKIVKI